MDNKNTNGDEQQKFLEILNALVEQAKKKENVLNFEDVEKAFSKVGVELDADKTEKVFEFLENKGIVAMVPDSSADDEIILDVDDEPTEEELENIEFKRQNENEKEQKQMQRELEYLVFDIQFIEYLSIGNKKDNNIEVYFSKISFGRKQAEITIERNYILCDFLRNLMKSGN